MKNLNFENAIKRYNKLMSELYLDHLMISDDNNNSDWNIRDLVSECQFNLNLYYQFGTNQYSDLHHEFGVDDYKRALSEVGKLKRFINTYSKFTDSLVCKVHHCSKYDN